ncbi:hypothetical protein LINPERHAP2_LOCUS17112 [Linum perenne]
MDSDRNGSIEFDDLVAVIFDDIDEQTTNQDHDVGDLPELFDWGRKQRDNQGGARGGDGAAADIQGASEDDD